MLYQVIQLWDVATQKLLYEIPEPGTKPPSFSRDGKYLLVKASVFDLATGAIVRQFTNDLGNLAFQAAFAADGESVVAVVDNDTIEVAPTVDRMLLYADALIQREPPTFTDWELRYFEIGQPVNLGEYQSLDAEILVPYDRPILSLTPRPRPNSATLSPLPTPTK